MFLGTHKSDNSASVSPVQLPLPHARLVQPHEDKRERHAAGNRSSDGRDEAPVADGLFAEGGGRVLGGC